MDAKEKIIKLLTDHIEDLHMDVTIRGACKDTVWKVTVHDNYESKRLGVFIYEDSDKDETKHKWVKVK
jgi:hypothetical protein